MWASRGERCSRPTLNSEEPRRSRGSGGRYAAGRRRSWPTLIPMVRAMAAPRPSTGSSNSVAASPEGSATSSTIASECSLSPEASTPHPTLNSEEPLYRTLKNGDLLHSGTVRRSPREQSSGCPRSAELECTAGGAQWAESGSRCRVADSERGRSELVPVDLWVQKERRLCVRGDTGEAFEDGHLAGHRGARAEASLYGGLRAMLPVGSVRRPVRTCVGRGLEVGPGRSREGDREVGRRSGRLTVAVTRAVTLRGKRLTPWRETSSHQGICRADRI